MPIQDTTKLKDKIISIIKLRGPSLPVHIAKETNQSILFASAFLSELISDKALKISNMKVGGSPLYLIPGQEAKLENFSQHLKNKEKEAFLLLKEKKFLKDNNQPPAIRVALRSIKDFAIPFQVEGEIFWRYFITPISEFNQEKNIVTTEIKKIPIKKKGENLNILKEKPKKPVIKKVILKKTPKKKSSSKINEKFFNKVKDFLVKNQMEITNIEGFSKNEFLLKIKENSEEYLLIAYNKKRVNESDLINAYKKAQELRLKYIILNKGGVSKKIQSLIDSIKNLSKIEKIE